MGNSGNMCLKVAGMAFRVRQFGLRTFSGEVDFESGLLGVTWSSQFVYDQQAPSSLEISFMAPGCLVFRQMALDFLADSRLPRYCVLRRPDRWGTSRMPDLCRNFCVQAKKLEEVALEFECIF